MYKTIQDTVIPRARAPEADSATAAAVDPELQKLLNRFQENIGTLTGIAQEVLCQLAEKYGVDWVHDAIQEAVIYEKRSLAYIRRVLEAWKRNGHVTGEQTPPQQDGGQKPVENSTDDQGDNSDLFWSPPGLFEGYQESSMSQPHNLAVAAWIAICDRLPEFNRMTKMVTPFSLIGNVLTVTTSDQRTYDVLANTRRYFVNVATAAVLGDEAQIYIELGKSKVGVE
jgi:DnaD/phage-associated family protein